MKMVIWADGHCLGSCDMSSGAIRDRENLDFITDVQRERVCDRIEDALRLRRGCVEEGGLVYTWAYPEVRWPRRKG